MRQILIALMMFAAIGPLGAEPTALEHLFAFMTGTFSNAEQARGDQNFPNATLHMTPIWTARSDGPWLYLEQALADAPAHPYRQLIYQLANGPDASLEIRVFDLPDPVAATGSWKDPARLDKLLPENLTARSGCTLILHLRPGGSIQGGTEGTGCASSLRGATYSAVETTITNLEITMWERGYNAAGVQVWGSLHGGYAFKRVE
jgi:CpeT protein